MTDERSSNLIGMVNQSVRRQLKLLVKLDLGSAVFLCLVARIAEMHVDTNYRIGICMKPFLIIMFPVSISFFV